MAPDFSRVDEPMGRMVASLYAAWPPATTGASRPHGERPVPSDVDMRDVVIVQSLFRAWSARLSDSSRSEAELMALGPALAALPAVWQAMAAVVRAEAQRMRGFPETALAEVERAIRDLASRRRSPFETELCDFARVLQIQCLADVGHLPDQRALLAAAPVSVQDWRRAHQRGETGQLLFVAATHYRALAGAACAAADEADAFKALLDEPTCPALVRAWGSEAMASVDFRAGRYPAALQWYVEAFAAAQAADARRQQFVAALNIATCHGNLNAPQSAAAWARRALEALPLGQWPVAEGLACLRLSTALRVACRPAEALLHAEQACAVLDGRGPSRNRRVAWLAHGEALLALGRPAEALVRFDAVCNETEPGAENDIRVEALRGRALALSRTGQPAAALEPLEPALALARSMGSRPREAECMLAQLEVWIALGPLERAKDGCDDDSLRRAFAAATEAMQAGGLPSLRVETQQLLAQWLTEQGRHEAAADAWRQVAQSWRERHAADLAEQLEGLENLSRLRMAEQALRHAREQHALLSSRLSLMERHAAMLEMLEAFSRQAHAEPEPESVFSILQHHVARLLGARGLQLWVLDGAGEWVCRLGGPSGAGAAARSGGTRVHMPLRVAGHLVGRLSAELPMPELDGPDRNEQRRILGLVAEHAALVLRSWLDAQRLRSATDAARQDATRERDGRERAERLVAEKRRFFAQAGHELRTPLNAIVGFGQLLAVAPELGEGPSRAHALTIVRAGRQLACLVDDLAELAALDAGSLSLTLEAVDVAVAIAGTMSLLEHQARQASIALGSAGDFGVLVHADRLRVQQMLSNLVGNGIKYGEPGGRVTVSFRRDAGWVRIDVEDDGIGVPEDARSGLFLPVNRLGRERSGIEGTGLGLSIVWRLARAMGGRVTYEPMDKGSRFSIWLPSA